MSSGLYHVNLFQKLFLYSALLCSCLFIIEAHAEKASTEEWNISADKITRYDQPSSIVAQGNVILIKREKMTQPRSAAVSQAAVWAGLLGEQTKTPVVEADDVAQNSSPQYQTTMTIKADWIVYDVELKLINAKGNVHIVTKEDQLTAKAGILNLVDQTGNFTDATVLHKNNTLHLEGKKIEKTGLDTYRINDGWVITCKVDAGETPPWSFSSSETNVRQDGFAVLKHAKFKIQDVPVFYTPYMLVPVKSTRQSGFIFPEFSSSDNNGFGVNLPFFLNISESADATFYPEYLTNRGFMPSVEFRYVASATDKGMVTATYLDDELSNPSETAYYNDTGYTHDNSDRYWLRGKADQTFANWQTRLDIDIVSDQDYLNEFDTGITGFEATQNRYLDTFGRGFQNKSDTLRENTLKTLRSWTGTSLQVSLLAVNDVDTNADSRNTPAWQLPRIDYSGVVPVGETYFSFDWDTNYVDYWREDGIGGHRFDVNPTLSSPIPLGPYIESRAEVGLHDTLYLVQTYGDAEWEKDDIQNRIYPEFLIEVATTLERDFNISGNEQRTLTHQARPYVQYAYIPSVDQDNLPQFDEIDFVDDKSAIVYGIDNYFNTFTGGEKNWASRTDYAELKVEQSYDVRDSESERPFSDIFLELKWWPLTGIALSYKNYYNVYDTIFSQHLFEGYYSNSRGDSLSLDYSYSQLDDIEQLNTTFTAHIISNWYVGGKVEQSISQDETVEARGSITYRAPCWAVKFETRYTPDDTAYLLVFSLANLGSPIGVNF